MHTQSSELSFRAPATREVASCAFAAIEVRREADLTVREAWAALEQAAPCSIYQTRAWLLPWMATRGARGDLAPAYVLAYDGNGRAIALLCLGTRRRGPVRVATFLGGKDSNASLALLRPDANWSADDLRLLLKRAARQLGVDAFVLVNQPFAWRGARNPFVLLPHQPSPSAAYGTALLSDAEAFLAAKLSKETRKKLRKKEARLAELGPVTYRVAATSADRIRMLDAFFRQRLERFRAQGVVSGFGDPQMRAFLDQAATLGEDGCGLELHALATGDRIVAIYGGAAHAGAWSGMVNSFDADPDVARSSPGDLLLAKVIAAQCAAGRSQFDLGIGEARYKSSFCDTAIPLFDTLFPTTLAGWIFTQAMAAFLRLKRRIKQDPRLLAWVKWLRRRPGQAT